MRNESITSAVLSAIIRIDFQGVGDQRAVFLAVGKDVPGQENRRSHGITVSKSLSCNVKPRSMVSAGADYGQTRSNVDAIAKAQGLERR